MVQTRLVATLSLILLAHANTLMAQTPGPRLHNPASLHTPRGYSHIAEVPAGSRMIFIAGQVALDKAGNLVGAGDVEAQTRQVFENLRLALADVGSTFADVVKMNIYMVDAGQIAALRKVRDSYLTTATPPASTLVEVRRLFREDILVEIEAVAIVPAR